jgi:hypothetical protein
VLEEMEETNMV